MAKKTTTGKKRETKKAAVPGKGKAEETSKGSNAKGQDNRGKAGQKSRLKFKVKKKHVYASVVGAVIVSLILIAVFGFGILEAGTRGQPSGIQAGYDVQLNYVGTFENGEVFDEGALSVKVGRGEVIKGFDDGLIGMEAGETKTVTIPPEEGYGTHDPAKVVSVELAQEGSRNVQLERFVTVPVGDFPMIFGKEPTIGDVVEYEPFEFKVGMVTDMVTLENIVKVGAIVRLPNTEWDSEVVEVGEELIDLRQDPKPGQTLETQFGTADVEAIGDKIIITIVPEIGKQIYTPAGVAVVSEANDTHLIVDTNHPLAGETLIFEIEVTSAQAPPVFERPNMKLFIMSFCPVGTMAEAFTYPVQQALGDKVDFDLHFVVYPSAMYAGAESQYCIEDVCSMHGIPELEEDMRQACIRDYEPDKLWGYLMDVMSECSIGNIGVCWEGAAEKNGIDVERIRECQAEEGVSLMQAERVLNTRYGVSGSPTIFINDDPYQGQRTSESLQEELCKYFGEVPDECFAKLGATVTGIEGEC